MTNTSDLKQYILPYLKEAFSKKIQNVTALDVRELTSYTDAIIIITASSARQLSAVAEHIYIKFKKKGKQALGVEGIKDSTWALLDFGDVIIHVFNPETRAFYDIEGLWSDAPRIDLSEFESQLEPLQNQSEN